MKTIVIYNRHSRSGIGYNELQALFATYQVKVDSYLSIDKVQDDYIQAEARAGTRFIVHGGDGTMNRIAGLVLYTPATLLPLPGGTFNQFMTDIGGSLLLEDIIAHYNALQKITVDVGRVNDRVFLNNSNIGLHPMSLVTRKQERKLFGKWVAAALSLSDQLMRFKRRKLWIDGTMVRTPFVFIGNNRYVQDKSAIPKRSRFDEAVLSLFFSPSATRRDLLKHSVRALRRLSAKDGGFHVSYRPSITIASRHPSLSISLDGEVLRLATPLQYSVALQALTILYLEVD